MGAPLEKLFDVGIGSLARGLEFEVRRSGEDVLVSLARETQLAGSALALPGLHGSGGLELLAERSSPIG